MDIEPFQVSTSQAALDDLNERLKRIRWPNELPGLGWTFGPPLDYMRELVEHWQSGFDWRTCEARINALPNYRVSVDGQELHFIHVRGKGPSPRPLLLTHGYPSTPYEFLELIDLLTNPAGHGRDPADAFDVVVPSIPGHGLSPGPSRTGFHDRDIAELLTELMAGLGYERFGIHAYDIGASIAAYACLDHAERIIGYHTTDPGNPGPDLGPESPPLTEAEQAFRDIRRSRGQQEGAYAQILRTRHQTLAYSLHDSPIGLAAWIIEKWFAWTVPPTGRLDDHFSRDNLLANVTIYWLTGTMNAANRYYAEDAPPLSDDDRITVPMGVAVPANEPARRPPREFIERRCTDIRHWVELPRGGHFVAAEAPDLVAASIQSFFRDLR